MGVQSQKNKTHLKQMCKKLKNYCELKDRLDGTEDAALQKTLKREITKLRNDIELPGVKVLKAIHTWKKMLHLAGVTSPRMMQLLKKSIFADGKITEEHLTELTT